MASSGKKRTTMAKLNRESRLRERRLDKQARKDARKNAPAPDPDAPDTLSTASGEAPGTGAGPALAGEPALAGQPALDTVVQALADA